MARIRNIDIGSLSSSPDDLPPDDKRTYHITQGCILEELERERKTLRYKVYYYLWRVPINTFNSLSLRIKFAMQRAFRGYDDSIFWSLDSAVAEIALPALRSMIKNGYGYPCHIESKEEWDEILKKILFAFEAIEKHDHLFCRFTDSDEWRGEDKELREKMDEGFLLFGKHFRSLWD